MSEPWVTAFVLLATAGFVCILSLGIWVIAHITLEMGFDAKVVASIVMCFILSLLLGGWAAYMLH